MKNFLNKAMLTLVVFGLAIVSSFAMETDPPTEPVKTTVETEVVEEVQPASLEGYGYRISPTMCVFIDELPQNSDCHPLNSGPICTQEIGDIEYDLVLFTRLSELHPWQCTTTEIRKKL